LQWPAPSNCRLNPEDFVKSKIREVTKPEDCPPQRARYRQSAPLQRGAGQRSDRQTGPTRRSPTNPRKHTLALELARLDDLPEVFHQRARGATSSAARCSSRSSSVIGIAQPNRGQKEWDATTAKRMWQPSCLSSPSPKRRTKGSNPTTALGASWGLIRRAWTPQRNEPAWLTRHTRGEYSSMELASR
jgi:hypothetical protein